MRLLGKAACIIAACPDGMIRNMETREQHDGPNGEHQELESRRLHQLQTHIHTSTHSSTTVLLRIDSQLSDQPNLHTCIRGKLYERMCVPAISFARCSERPMWQLFLIGWLTPRHGMSGTRRARISGACPPPFLSLYLSSLSPDISTHHRPLRSLPETTSTSTSTTYRMTSPSQSSI
jgi:hypothetical protein